LQEFCFSGRDNLASTNFMVKKKKVNHSFMDTTEEYHTDMAHRATGNDYI